MWKLTGLLSRVASTESLSAGQGGCGEHHSRGGSQPGEHVAGGSSCCGEKLGGCACLSEREASGARAGVLTLLLFMAMVWSDLGETETDARPEKWQQAEFV